MAPHTRTPSPTSSRLLMVVGVLLIAVSLAHGYPMSEGRELDSAVVGVQKYLESSGFPKMTRGEVLDFLADFSRNARVSRSENAKKRSAAIADAVVVVTPTVMTAASPETQQPVAAASNKPRIPAGESPLNYGYPMSSAQPKSAEKVEKERHSAESVMRAIGEAKKSGTHVGPSVDLNAYAKFKKIPEAKNLKIDDDMRSFLGGFGLVDGKAATTTTTPRPAQRRADDVITTEEPTLDDVSLLRSVLHETGLDKANGSGSSRSLRFPLLTDIPTAAAESKTRDHVFNPSDPDVRTVDVNRIAKIVQNIRLLADDNDTVSLSQEAIQKKLENITAAIAAIDDQQPQAQDVHPAPNKAFDGYEVFFDDEDSKEVDSDLPEAPTGSLTGPGADVLLQQLPLNHKPAHYPPPDPLSTDELQHLLEKNKHEVKRQQPAAEAATDETTTAAATTSPPQTTSEAVVTVTAVAMDAAAAVTDSSSAATGSEVTSSEANASEESTSDANSARDSSTAAASDVGSPSLSQLAESFGGGETASNAPPAEEEAVAAGPDRPKSGLYFYVDWNSFLTVNSGQKNQVNLRFAPKAGNANHFIKVNVP